jgi:hypothetical protein
MHSGSKSFQSSPHRSSKTLGIVNCIVRDHRDDAAAESRQDGTGWLLAGY